MQRPNNSDMNPTPTKPEMKLTDEIKHVNATPEFMGKPENIKMLNELADAANKTETYDELIQANLNVKDWWYLKASAEHFLTSGKASGSFRTSLHVLMDETVKSHLATLRTRIQEEIRKQNNTEYRPHTQQNLIHEAQGRIDALEWVLTQIGGDQ